jgi:hypothetical protein
MLRTKSTIFLLLTIASICGCKKNQSYLSPKFVESGRKLARMLDERVNQGPCAERVRPDGYRDPILARQIEDGLIDIGVEHITAGDAQAEAMLRAYAYLARTCEVAAMSGEDVNPIVRRAALLKVCSEEAEAVFHREARVQGRCEALADQLSGGNPY